MDTVVIDNGSADIKAGLASRHADAPALLAPNAVMRCRAQRRNFIAGQLASLPHKIGLHYRRPFEDGYCTHAELQRIIWAHSLTETYGLGVDFGQHRLLVTEPPFNFNPLRINTHELAFEEFGFASLCCARAADLAAYGAVAEYGGNSKKTRNTGCLVVDAGHAFSHIIPYYGGQPLLHATRRVDVGGRTLTNFLKDLVSYRAVDLSAELYVVERMKMAVLQCVPDLNAALEAASTPRLDQNPFAIDYILPDYTTTTEGAIAPRAEMLQRPRLDPRKGSNPHIVRLNTERFLVPEALFRPKVVDMDQMGIVDAAAEALAACPRDLQPSIAANIVLVGGTANIAGLQQRFTQDLRALLPADLPDVTVRTPDSPHTFAYRSGCLAAKDPTWNAKFVSKAEFEEHGHRICLQRFYAAAGDDA